MFLAAFTSRFHTIRQWGQVLSRQLSKGEGPSIRVLHLEHILEVRNSSTRMTATPGNRESALRIRARGEAMWPRDDVANLAAPTKTTVRLPFLRIFLQTSCSS